MARRPKTDITVEEVRRTFSYDPETGIFIRLIGGRGVRPSAVGKPVGTPDGEGYLLISAGGRLRKAHRLAWLHVTGQWPEDEIDHINGNRSDNRWQNLREATSAQNQQNRRVTAPHGYKGTTYISRVNKWKAHITVDKECIHLGYYDRVEEAHAAYCHAANILFGEFARAA